MIVIVASLIESVPRLFKWLLTVAFLTMVFALCGESLFGTVYFHRCRLTSEPVPNALGDLHWPIDPDQTRFCGGRYICRDAADGNPTFCGSTVTNSGGIVKGIDPWPELYNNPESDYGYTGFQSFGAACLTVFHASTKEGWADILYRFQDGRGSFIALFFVISLVIF